MESPTKDACDYRSTFRMSTSFLPLTLLFLGIHNVTLIHSCVQRGAAYEVPGVFVILG